MAEKLVSVYDKDGTEHQMTYPNARDMVVHAGWRWNLVDTKKIIDVVSDPSIPSSVDTVVTVYDRDGNGHQMTWANARDLIKNAGWTREPLLKAPAVEVVASTQPVAEPGTIAPEAAEKKDEEPAPQPVTEADASTPDPSATVDFESMTKEEIDVWAKTTLKLELDGRWSKAKMIAAVREHLAG